MIDFLKIYLPELDYTVCFSVNQNGRLVLSGNFNLIVIYIRSVIDSRPYFECYMTWCVALMSNPKRLIPSQDIFVVGLPKKINEDTF